MQLHTLERFVGFCASTCLCLLHAVAALVALFDSIVYGSIFMRVGAMLCSSGIVYHAVGSSGPGISCSVVHSLTKLIED